MAENDPTKDQGPIHLGIRRRNRKFLEEVLAMARDGVRDDLSEHGGRLRRPDRRRRELVAYERLLGGLAGEPLAPDPCLRSVLAELARVVDDGNEYARAVAEHAAMDELLAALDRAAGPRSRRGARCAAIRCRGDSHAPRR